MPVTDSPMRYPGGKSQLAPYVIELMRANNLFYGGYAEPFAGGCGIAWTLLLNNYVSHVYINDIDPSIYALWASVLRQTEAFCGLIDGTDVTMEEWHQQREVQRDPRARILERGFSTLFLNRTNRSGIIGGGVIGGHAQAGNYPLDCRFNKKDLIKKIRRIGAVADQVTLTKLDAEIYIRETLPKLPKKTLVNIDPPYYAKGPGLYRNHYEDADHRSLAKAVATVAQPWMVTYDDTPEIRDMYSNYPSTANELRYSAQIKRVGVELLILDPRLSSATDAAAA